MDSEPTVPYGGSRRGGIAMTVSYEVLGFYAALVVWAVLLGFAVKQKSYRTFLGFGIAILLFLNIRYLVTGSANGIANFIGIYDVFDNIGLGSNESAAALAQCPDNACTVWGDRYVNHQSWGVAFYDRFANGRRCAPTCCTPTSSSTPSRSC